MFKCLHKVIHQIRITSIWRILTQWDVMTLKLSNLENLRALKLNSFTWSNDQCSFNLINYRLIPIILFINDTLMIRVYEHKFQFWSSLLTSLLCVEFEIKAKKDENKNIFEIFTNFWWSSLIFLSNKLLLKRVLNWSLVGILKIIAFY